MQGQSGQSSFVRNAKNTLYSTSNRQYGSPWIQDNVRPEQVNIKNAKIPTYSEIVDSMNNFKKTERLIKSKVIKDSLDRQRIDPNNQNVKYMKKTDFHIKKEYDKYPQSGINVGPPIYRTNNMNYGSSQPAEFEIPTKYCPTNNTFTKEFNGGTFKFNGLNTVKTVSGVHSQLNDI